MPLSLIPSGGAGLHRGRWMTSSSSDVHCDVTLGEQLFCTTVEGLWRVCSVRFRGLAKFQCSNAVPWELVDGYSARNWEGGNNKTCVILEAS